MFFLGTFVSQAAVATFVVHWNKRWKFSVSGEHWVGGWQQATHMHAKFTPSHCAVSTHSCVCFSREFRQRRPGTLLYWSFGLDESLARLCVCISCDIEYTICKLYTRIWFQTNIHNLCRFPIASVAYAKHLFLAASVSVWPTMSHHPIFVCNFFVCSVSPSGQSARSIIINRMHRPLTSPIVLGRNQFRTFAYDDTCRHSMCVWDPELANSNMTKIDIICCLAQHRKTHRSRFWFDFCRHANFNNILCLASIESIIEPEYIQRADEKKQQWTKHDGAEAKSKISQQLCTV